MPGAPLLASRPHIPVHRAKAAAVAPRLPALIEALKCPLAYPHPVREVHLVQTHISWVLLTGEYAYKIKKPVDLGFLDFSTLSRRQQACEEELRLNRRWSPDLYLDVVPITGTPATPRFDGTGPAFEYAVRMRQFPLSQQVDRRLAAGVLSAQELMAFADVLARAHAAAPVAPSSWRFGSVGAVRRPVEDTLAALRGRAHGAAETQHLAAISQWLHAHPDDALLGARKADGFIREVHGDLHLANLVSRDGGIQAFDCLEFDPALRWIDVMSDVAFLVMDLEKRGRRDLAYAFLSRYLEGTGDYAGLGVFRYYLVYRALIRAKIAAIRRDTDDLPVAEATSVLQYLSLAAAHTLPRRPALVLMHGLSGSGKTRLSEELIPLLPAVRLRSDLERRRARVLDARVNAAPGRYASVAVAANYAHLAHLTEAVLGSGETVLVDATFLSRGERQRFYALAQLHGLPCVVVGCRAPREILEQRVTRRARHATDASEADAAVLAAQLEAAEPLAPEERTHAIEFDTSQPVDARVVVREIAQLAARR